MRLFPALALASLVASAPAAAATTFFDGFEGEAPAGSVLNYAGFVNWTVSDGTFDLVKSGDFGITCRSGSFCVDLDGSTGDAGVLTLTSPIAIAPGDFVDIVFWLSGNQRGGATDLVNFSIAFSSPTDVIGFQLLTGGVYGPPSTVGGVTGAFSAAGLTSGDPFASYGFRFTSGSASTMTLRFSNNGGDNIGAILDDVSIRVTPAIPEPGTWAMLIAGFGLVGAAARRRRLAAA